MDPRVFLLICLAAASRHQPSSVLEVEANDPQTYAFNETDFQRLRDLANSGDSYRIQELRDAVNSGDWDRMYRIAHSKTWPSFLKAHPEEGLGLFKKLAKDQDIRVRQGAAESPAWPMLLETHNAEAARLFEKLATHKNEYVRLGAARSPAWPMLLETNFEAAQRLFEELANDDHVGVGRGAAYSPAWPNLVRSNWWKAWQLFCKLMSDQDLVQPEFSASPAWKAFGNVPLTGVAEYLDSFTPTNLQDTAMSLQKMADYGFVHKVKDLQLVTFIANRLQRSANETWLGEMARLPLFAGNAALSASLAKNVWALLASTSNFRIFK